MGAMVRLAIMFALLTIIFVGIGWVIGYYIFNSWMLWMLIFLVFAVVMNVVSYFLSDKIVLKMYSARIVDHRTAPRLVGIVEEVANKAEVPMPRVAIIPQRNPNAFATGRNPDNAVVAATEGILDILDDDELEGVIAHEMAHVRNRDILVMAVAATVAGAIAIAARWAFWAAVFNRGNVNIWVLLLAAITAPIAAILIKSAISRNREYKADATGAQIIGKPLALASALQKLERGKERYPIKEGSPTTSHMFIVNPFKGGFAGLFASHPPTDERIKRLRSMQ